MFRGLSGSVWGSSSMYVFQLEIQKSSYTVLIVSVPELDAIEG
jgi:hypothetical protein